MSKSAPLRWTQLLACAYALGVTYLCHARWMPVPFLVTLLAAVGLRIALRKHSARKAPILLKLVLMIAFAALVLREFHNLFGREAGSGLLAAMLALKLVETETRRDGLLLLAIASFLAMCGFLFDQGILQAIVAAIALAFLVASLNVLQPLPDDAPAEARRDAWWPYADLGLASLARLMLLALPFALACFVFFPRLDRPMWGAPEDAFKGRTGISERMTPGALASIALDDRTAFQVRYQGTAPVPRLRYYRVLTLIDFDGNAWTPGAARPGAQAGDYHASGPTTTYDVLLDPTDQRWLPLLDLPLSTTAEAGFDLTHQANTQAPVTSARAYQGVSATQYRLLAMSPDDYPATLQLPRRGNPRARELARSWRAQQNQPEAIVNAALGMFHDSFAYSLEPPMVGANGVDDFLFEFKSGYCEHFAGAFAFLMRAAGIPARVVIGFQGGYFNSVGGFFNVRFSDAHAWTEVWLAGKGWVRVDPTAAVSPERIERGSLADRSAAQAWYASGGIWAAFRDRVALVGYWWNRAVVEFTALRQRDLIEALGLGDDSGFSLALAMVISALLALGLAGWLVSRRAVAATDPVLAAYRRYCRRLGQAGIARNPSEGPSEFSRRAAAALPHAAPEILRLSADFVRLRYASHATAAGELRRDWLRRIRRFRVPRAATQKRA